MTKPPTLFSASSYAQSVLSPVAEAHQAPQACPWIHSSEDNTREALADLPNVDPDDAEFLLYTLENVAEFTSHQPRIYVFGSVITAEWLFFEDDETVSFALIVNNEFQLDGFRTVRWTESDGKRVSDIDETPIDLWLVLLNLATKRATYIYSNTPPN